MIYIFLADGFEEIEALTAVDVLRRAELPIVTVGLGSRNITGAHHIPVIADIEANEVINSEMEMMILPGGMPGTVNLENSPLVGACVEYCARNNIPIAAICAAPSILGHAGVLRGKHAVCFPGFESELQDAKVEDTFVCRDENIITGKGAGAALLFALEIVTLFKGKNFADELKAEMQCP